MGAVLSFFALIFAIVRLCGHIGADGYERRMERRYGTLTEFKAGLDVDEKRKHSLIRWIKDEANYDKAWEILEEGWRTKREEIEKTKRVREIWHMVMSEGRRPFAFYSTKFLKEHGYDFWKIGSESMAGIHLDGYYFTPLRFRAVHCLMWLEGKCDDWDAIMQYALLTGTYRKSEDFLLDESWGVRDRPCLKEYDIPWWPETSNESR